MNYTIILSSSSKYRRALLERLKVPFQYQSPDIDETPQANEKAEDLVERLSINKAKATATVGAPQLVIGSDQVATLNGEILCKSGSFERAKQQLIKQSAQKVVYYTGLCVYCAEKDIFESCVVPYSIQFRTLDEATITRYLEAEQPYDCAGSIKSEGLGITLFEKMTGDDPTALIGLPLITLSRLLRNYGVQLP